MQLVMDNSVNDQMNESPYIMLTCWCLQIQQAVAGRGVGRLERG